MKKTLLLISLIFTSSFLISQEIKDCNIIENFQTPYTSLGDLAYTNNSVFFLTTKNLIIEISTEDGSILNELELDVEVSFDSLTYDDGNLWTTDIINKVKEIISRPEFAYEDTDDIDNFRKTVFKWCKILSDEGLGAIAYPKTYKGGGDMNSYFAVMETLSYHDLSLVIKLQQLLTGNFKFAIC